jgi:hypothetical protein
MRRKAAVFAAFNACLFCIVSAFFNALPELFYFDFLSPQLSFGLDAKGSEWDGRYLLFFLLSIAGNAVAAIVAGALANERGGVAAAKGAIPLTLLWAEMFFLALFTGSVGATAISLIAIPFTIFTAAYWGRFGERIQKEQFPEGTLFGIYPYHLIWMTVPLFLSAFGTATWLPYLEGVLFHNWRGAGGAKTAAHLLSLGYTLLPFLGLAALLYLVYKILTGEIFKIGSEWGKALLSIGVLIVVPVLFYQFLLLIGWLMRLIPLEGI